MSGHYSLSPQSSSSSPSKHRRADMDLSKLLKKYKVFFIDGTREFLVTFEGPLTSPYEGGFWAIRCDIPPSYPFKSPSVGFINRIYHPNVDEASGSVCLDVINQKWSSIFDLCHIFDHFLPCLLQEPNISDPLNQAAAHQMSQDKTGYDMTVKDYILKYAKGDHWIKAIKDTCPEPPTDEELFSHLSEMLSLKRSSESLSSLGSFISAQNTSRTHSLTGASSATIFDLEMEDSPHNNSNDAPCNKLEKCLNDTHNRLDNELDPESDYDNESSSTLSEYSGNGYTKLPME